VRFLFGKTSLASGCNYFHFLQVLCILCVCGICVVDKLVACACVCVCLCVCVCARAKFERLDVQKEYDKRRAMGKDNINLVVIGEAGSTVAAVSTVCYVEI